MQRALAGRKLENGIADVLAGLDAGEDPRAAMARLNARIVDHQKAGETVPPRLIRLSQVLATECAAHSQGR